jgi:hypothetical protein
VHLKSNAQEPLLWLSLHTQVAEWILRGVAGLRPQRPLEAPCLATQPDAAVCACCAADVARAQLLGAATAMWLARLAEVPPAGSRARGASQAVPRGARLIIDSPLAACDASYECPSTVRVPVLVPS